MSEQIDRVARRMTSGPGPRPDFASRVMSRVHADAGDHVVRAAVGMTAGSPRAGFSNRVLARLDEQPVRSTWLRPALIGVSMAAVAIGVVVWRAGAQVQVPATPRAPKLTNYAYDRGPIGLPTLPEDRWPAGMTDVAGFEVGAVRRTNQVARLPIGTGPEPIRMIEALAGPAQIELTQIGPSMSEVPALSGPAPLKIPDLPGQPGGSLQKDPKEKS
jgi:hypothetical protein